MPTSPENRRTTADGRAAKLARVKAALLNPATADLPNRELARLLSVDESMVRRHRQAIAERLKKDAGTKGRGRPST